MAATTPTPSARVAAPVYHEFLGTQMVELFVGPQKELLHVHKTLLCQKVPHFAEMFRKGSRAAKRGSATFPEDTMESFGLLIEWIYTGRVRTLLAVKELAPTILHLTTPSWSVYDAYELAEKLCVHDFMDGIMDAFRLWQKETNQLMNYYQVQRVYKTTEPNSPLGRYATDSLAYIFNSTKGNPDDWPSKAISDLLGKHEAFRNNFFVRLRSVSGSPPGPFPDPRIAPDCEYHHHGKDKVCPIREII